jgi:hypothetical protein
MFIERTSAAALAAVQQAINITPTTRFSEEFDGEFRVGRSSVVPPARRSRLSLPVHAEQFMPICKTESDVSTEGIM